MKQRYDFIFVCVDIQLFWFFEEYSFLCWIVLVPCQKSVGHKGKALFLDSSLFVLSAYVSAPIGSMVKNLPLYAGDVGSIPELGRSPGEGNSNPLQYSCLENPMDRGAWWATVHGVAESDTTTTQQQVTKLHCLDYCNFVVSFDSGKCEFSTLVFLKLLLVGGSPFPHGSWVISEGCRPLCWEIWPGDSTLAWAESRLLLPEIPPPRPPFTGVRPTSVSTCHLCYLPCLLQAFPPVISSSQHLLLREAELTRFPNLEFLTLFPGPFDIWYLGMYQSTRKEKCWLLETALLLRAGAQDPSIRRVSRCGSGCPASSPSTVSAEVANSSAHEAF